MDILVIGVSNIFLKRMLPALLASPAVGRIHLASRRADVRAPIPAERMGRVFEGYQAALDALEPCLAYISLPNHLHGEWTRAALEAGFHVIVDKPAVLALDEAEALVALAAERGRCLAEATVWQFHPQVETARAIFADVPGGVRSIQSTFAFPRPPAANFRNDPSMGGGAFWDLEAYAISPGRVFFGGLPVDVSCQVLSRDAVSGLDTSFAITTVYEGGQVLQGFFCFGAEYRNTMTLIGASAAVALDPAFTSQRDAELTVRLRARDVTEARVVPAADTFQLFTERVIDSIHRGDWAEWPTALLQDAAVAHRAAHSARVNRNAD